MRKPRKMHRVGPQVDPRFGPMPDREYAVSIDPSAIEAIQALGLGFAFAGFLASAFELFTERKASFHLLQGGGFGALASVPVVVFSAPFIIVRNTLRGRRIEDRPFHLVMIATKIASFWSLMSGRLVLDLALVLAGS
jgi:hypothetical protein